jgi:D-alanyl-D-alanine carboxypeptidase
MQTRSFAARLAGPLLLVLAASPAVAQPDPSIEGRLQAYLDSLHAAGSFPGATVGVAFADGWSVALSTGQADTARDTPMPPEAGMLAGSVGKTFFAALALELVRDG